jgi:hypothetical protein
MPAITFGGVALVILLTPPAVATAQRDSVVHHAEGKALVVHTFTIPVNEFIRVRLDGGTTYRVELDGTGISLRVRPLMPGTQEPRVLPVLAGTGAAGTSLYDLHTYAPGVYQFRSVGGDPTRPVTIHVSRRRRG